MDRYKKNSEMDFMEMDDGQLVVFDPESGDTHFIDEIGHDILENLSEGDTIDGVISALCEIYDATPEDINGDVSEFFEQMLQKKVVLPI